MRVKITHLKAPWPCGAVVGDVIELPVVPAWAKGKCVPAPEGTEPTVVFPPTVEPVEPEPARDLGDEVIELTKKLAEANEVIGHQVEVLKDYRKACIDAEAALAAQARAESEVVELRQKLTAAEAALAGATFAGATGEAMTPAGSNTLTGDGSGKALPPIDLPHADAKPARKAK